MEKGNRKLHFLDKYVGIPLVYLLGAFKFKKKALPADIKRLAIINLVSIGDNVLMSGVIRDIRAQYPNMELVVFTGSTNYHLVQMIEGVTQVVKMPLTNPLKSVELLRSNGEFDVVIDFVSWPRINALYTFFTKAKYSIGFKVNGHYKHYLYDHKVLHRSDLHEIDNLRNLINAFYKGKNNTPALTVTPTLKSTAFIKSANSYCVIHAWPGGYKNHLKQWDKRRWAQLIQKLSKDFDTFLITGSPADVEKSAALEALVDKKNIHSKVLNIAGQFSLQEVVHIVDKADCVITVDTGISHIAAALNTPLICLQGPASSLRWRPYNDASVVVNPDRGTFGYLSFGYEYHLAKENCMDNIAVDTVYEEYLNLKKRNGKVEEPIETYSVASNFS